NVAVAGLDGSEQASHFYDGGVTPTKRILASFGYEIEVTFEHPLLRLTPEGTIQWTRADELRVGDFVAIQRGQNMFGSATKIHFDYQGTLVMTMRHGSIWMSWWKR